MCWLGWKQSKKGAARGLSLGADKVEPTLVASFKVSWDTPLFNNRFSPAGLSVPRSIRKIRTFTRNGVHPPHLQNQKRIRHFLARPATIQRARVAETGQKRIPIISFGCKAPAQVLVISR